MSRSDWACRGCRRVLARRHHTGRLHPEPDVTVYAGPKGRFGPYTRLVCPVCGQHRDYTDGPVVVRPRPLPHGRGKQRMTVFVGRRGAGPRDR